MKKLIYISLIILIIFSSCKSTKKKIDNQLDVITTKVASTENNISVSEIELNESEITLLVADPKKEIIITDAKGNSKKFKNVKSINIKKKQLQEKDSTTLKKKSTSEKVINKSKIKQQSENISDTKNFKGIFVAISFSLLFILIIYLIYKFKK